MFEIRRDTWCCWVAGLFAADRIVKLVAQKGLGFAIGPFEYSSLPLVRFFASASARESAFIFFPPILLIFWLFYRYGGLKSRLWSLFIFAGMVGIAFDVLLLRGVQYCFSIGTSSGAVVFNLATVYLVIGVIAGIWEMAASAAENA